MKKILLLPACLFVLANGVAQQMRHCGTTKAMNTYLKDHPEIKQKLSDIEQKLAKEDADAYLHGYRQTNDQAQGTVYYVPLVFHVIHANGPENISDAQIMDEVNILNRDYRKQNADTAQVVVSFRNLVADAQIEFRMATIDPWGNCTNGITRHDDTHTHWQSTDFSGFLYTWDPTKYLNIYVVADIDGGSVGGYAFIPGSFGAGAPYDVVVIDNVAVGTIGTAWAGLERCLTHEVGHWFNLPHPWGNSNNPGVTCGDDGVSDTPVTQGSTSCDTSMSVCNPPIIENAQNYMDYSFCSVMFTTGQVARMRNFIQTNVPPVGRDQVVSAANITATGAGLPIPGLCAGFKSDKKFICAGDSVSFSDSSWINTPVISWQWSFAGGTPSISNNAAPMVHYSSGGFYAVSYTATNSSTSASITKTDYVTVYPNTSAHTAPFMEGFETSAVPGTDWNSFSNNAPVTWQVSTAAAASGSRSLFIDNLHNGTANQSTLLSNSFYVGNLVAPTMTFKVAYQAIDTSYHDVLQLQATTDCGYTWTPLWMKAGAALTTSNSTSNAPYIPASSEFVMHTVDLSNVAINGPVVFRWQFLSDTTYTGNNLYLDDINIFDASAGMNSLPGGIQMQLYPNPSNGSVKLGLRLDKEQAIAIRIMDVTGRVVESMPAKNYPSGDVVLTLSSELSRGVYFVRVDVDGHEFSRKLIIH